MLLVLISSGFSSAATLTLCPAEAVAIFPLSS
uniref:Uncharacterized protein n=1 Tax=Rhizophora mucronata TaxID=61149 RepID=A0A2P2KI20_RHIMU